MKKFLFLVSVVLLGIPGITYAQLAQGNFMVGTDIGSGLVNPASTGLFSMNFGLNEGAGYNIGLSPKAGYFFTDNFLLGAVVNLGFTKSAEQNGQSTKTTVYGIQALSRHYINPEEADMQNLANNGRFFIELNAGVSGVNIKDGSTTNGFGFGFGPGFAYFLTPNVAFESTLKYNGLTGAGNEDHQHALGLNVGINVYFTRSTAEGAIEDFE